MKVVVGSNNPAKIRAVQKAFDRLWPDQSWEVIGVDVDSGVSKQPMSDPESLKGAKARAQKAFKEVPDADFAVGMEGGMHQVEGHWVETGWCFVVDKKGVESIGSSIRMPISQKIYKMVREGMELGDIIDALFKTKNLKHASGYFGIMTNDVLPRDNAYSDGLVSALSRFVKPEVFED